MHIVKVKTNPNRIQLKENKMKPILAVLFMTAAFSISFARADGPLPVVPAKDQQALLKSSDAKLAFNKKLSYDFFRVILIGRHLDQISTFMREDYIQHNPNVDTGEAGFLKYIAGAGGPTTIPNEVQDLVSIQAEGDFVTLSFVNAVADYTTTWFDMFRIQDGKIAEHWDCALKDASTAAH
jgi:predicted SnoaL-like aldol condensation-catalyzing enzyme